MVQFSGATIVNEQIRKLYDDIAAAVKRASKAEDDYQKALKNPKGKDLPKLAEDARKAQERLENLTKTAKELQQGLKLDLSKVTPLVGTLNQLGALSKTVGVNLEGVTNTLVQGFLRGKLSITQFNDELKKSQEILGKGIPDKVGATKEAFSNLIEGGLQGGIFSVDAFRDVFTEFNEQFAKESSPIRKKQKEELTAAFNTARDALDAALSGGGGDVDELRKQFDGAKKALEDFNASTNKAGFADLRSELEKSFSKNQVDVFFKALEDSGIKSFDDFENASEEAVTKILADLKDLGFDFGQTSDRVKNILKGTDDAIVTASGGKDVLQTSLDVIGKFNGAVDVLSGKAGGVTDALGVLSSEFAKVIDQIGQLDGNTFRNTVIFDVKTNGSSGEKALVEALYGDGSGSSDDVDGGSPGHSLNKKQQRRLKDLLKKKRAGTLTPREARDLSRLEDLRA